MWLEKKILNQVQSNPSFCLTKKDLVPSSTYKCVLSVYELPKIKRFKLNLLRIKFIIKKIKKGNSNKYVIKHNKIQIKKIKKQ